MRKMNCLLRHAALFFLFAQLFLSTKTFSQPGKDGSKIISGPAIINEFTFLVSDGMASSNTIGVNNTILNTSRFAGPLNAGDLLLIIQMQGAKINNTNDNNWGQVLDYKTCGRYEFAEVLDIPDARTIRLTCGLKNDYSAAGHTQVVRVPRYASLVLNSNLSTTTWDGRSGGIVVMEVKGTTTIGANGSIDVSEKGFRGGATGDLFSAIPGPEIYASVNPDLGGEKGEGIAGYESDYTPFGGQYDRGAPANGGGGGNCHNSGGGGGANGGDTAAWNGNGNPDLSRPAYTAAWNQESPGFAGSISSGGGRGGCTFSYIKGPNAVTPQDVPPGDSFWGGDFRRNVGGKGGRPLDYSTGRIFMGGGGGEGDANDNGNFAGGNGGGLVYILSCGTISGTGRILANGAKGGDASKNNGNDGASGGGGGGTIVLNSTGTISSTLSLSAKGGDGGNQVISAHPGEAEGPGGGGGGGMVLLSNGNPACNLSGGLNGTTNAGTLASFPPNGATAGGAGSIGSINPSAGSSITVQDTTRCPGAASLKAVPKGSFLYGQQIIWYDAPSGGKILHTGPVFSTPVLYADTTYYVQNTCPGMCLAQTGLIPAHVYIKPIVSDAGKDVAFCSGFQASLGTTPTADYIYSWSPAKGLSDSTAAAPLVSLKNGGAADLVFQYKVITSKKKCSGVESKVNVTVHNLPVSKAGTDTNACLSLTKKIGSLPHLGYFYKWTPGVYLDTDSIANPTVSTKNTTAAPLLLKYHLKVFNNLCYYNDSIQLGVYPLIKTDTVGHSPVSCQNDSVALVAKDGITYKWSNGSITPSIKVSPSETSGYTVSIFNGGCAARDTFTVIIKNNPIPEIYVPNAFSPNGDGLNDIFQAKCERLKEFEGLIFNKWGELIFEWNSLEKGWDGKLNEKPVPPDLYVYRIRAKKTVLKNMNFYRGQLA